MSFALRRLSHTSKVALRASASRRCMATAASDSVVSTSSSPLATSASPVINRIVDDISGLTLLQAADLVSLLKTRLNIQEIAMPTAAAPAAVAASEDAPAVEEKPKEKTIFTVNLVKFDATAKAKIIKEVKSLVPNMTLMDAKKFVESLPKPLKENVPKEEAEKIQKALTELGATIELA